MKRNIDCSSVLLVVILYVLAFVCNVEAGGKCQGSWSGVHGCHGGNGKRSKAESMDKARKQLIMQNMLEKLLRSQARAQEYPNTMPDTREELERSSVDYDDSNLRLQDLIEENRALLKQWLTYIRSRDHSR